MLPRTVLTTAVLTAGLLAVPTWAQADTATRSPGYLLGAGSGLHHAADNTARCTAGFLLRVNGRRQVLTAGQCAGATGNPVTSSASIPGLHIGAVTLNGLHNDGSSAALDAAIFAPRPGIYAQNYFITEEGFVHGTVTAVAPARRLIGSRYVRSGQGSNKTTGVITDSRVINGWRHYCGDGPAMAPGDLGGPVALTNAEGRPAAAAGIATATGDDGRMCFLPMSTLLSRFKAELGRPGSD